MVHNYFYVTTSTHYISQSTYFHAHTKHVEIGYHFICEKVAQCNLVTKHIPTSEQLVDLCVSCQYQTCWDWLSFCLWKSNPGNLVTKHVPKSEQLVDLFTKHATKQQLPTLLDKLGVHVPPTPNSRTQNKSDMGPCMQQQQTGQSVTSSSGHCS